MKNIGQRIISRRTELNISQTDLARQINESKQTLYKYEKGIITNIPIENLERIAKALEVNPAWLCGWSDRKEDEV